MDKARAEWFQKLIKLTEPVFFKACGIDLTYGIWWIDKATPRWKIEFPDGLAIYGFPEELKPMEKLWGRAIRSWMEYQK